MSIRKLMRMQKWLAGQGSGPARPNDDRLKYRVVGPLSGAVLFRARIAYIPGREPAPVTWVGSERPADAWKPCALSR